MTDLRHYLELRFAGQVFLMPNGSDISVEPRENMQLEQRGRAAALRTVQGESWLAYALGPDWSPRPDAPWTRAVFLNNGASQPVGVLVDDLKLLPVGSMRIEPFTPLGPAPVPGRHLFPAAAVGGGAPILVISPEGLATYLRSLGGDSGLGE